MASRAQRRKTEQEEKRKLQQKKQDDMLAEVEKAREVAETQAILDKDADASRVFERAKDVMKQLISKIQKENTMDAVLEWKGAYSREKRAKSLDEERKRREQADAELREKEEELKREYEKDMEKHKTALKDSGVQIEAEGEIENERPPNERDCGNRMWAVDNLLDPQVRSGIRNMHIQKVGMLCVNLQSMNYNHTQINDIVRALFLTQTEEDMKPAFQVFDVAGRGEVQLDEFAVSLSAMGEDVPKDKLDMLFKEADLDGSGAIDFQEFVVMMRKFNPMPKTITRKEYSSKGGTVAAVLDKDLQRALHPLQKAKAGKIVQQMLAAKYTEFQVNAVVRALYTGKAQCDPVWKQAWDVFDYDGSGALDATEFRRALRLMGEKVSEARLDELFAMADEDGSGEIEFEEFVMLLRVMNPKPSIGAISKMVPKGAPASNSEGPPIAGELREYLKEVGIEEYATEFAQAKLTNPKKIEEMSLVHLGNSLTVAKSERNLLYNKIQGYKSRIELKKKVDYMKITCDVAKSKAGIAKRNAKQRETETQVNLFDSYTACQQAAVTSIPPKSSQGRRITRPGHGIAAEMASLLGVNTTAKPVTVSPTKLPPALRSPLNDAEWNLLASPPRSPESRMPGYRRGCPTPVDTSRRPGLPHTPYLRRSHTVPALAEPPQWLVSGNDWHRNPVRHGPRIEPLGTVRFVPPPGTRSSQRGPGSGSLPF